MKIWVFSGGGARIIQQLDMIRHVLDLGGRLPDRIVGTSAGALLAFGISHLGVEDFRRKVLELDSRRDVFGGNLFWGLGKLGVWNWKPLMKLLEEIRLAGRPTIPFDVGTYDLEHKRLRYVDHGHASIVKFTVASAAIPLLVEPAQEGANKYWDGGIRSVTPLSQAVHYGPDEIEIFMASAEPHFQPARIDSKWDILMELYEDWRGLVAENDMKMLHRCNQLPGFKRIEATMYRPTANRLGLLDFDLMAGVAGTTVSERIPLVRFESSRRRAT